VRVAAAADCTATGELLDAFNREYGDETPGATAIANRIAELMTSGDTAVLLAGDGPDGLAVLRFRANLWSQAAECYLAELYVTPPRRGCGLGRALMERTLSLARERGCDRIELGTSEDDVVARKLYERMGFTNLERPGGPVMYVYERDL